MHDAKWLFPQEKATLYELKKVYVYSENALRSLSHPFPQKARKWMGALAEFGC
jgi:hypothetical protein